MTCTSDVEQNGRNCSLKRIWSVKFMTCFNVMSSHFKRGVKEANKMCQHGRPQYRHRNPISLEDERELMVSALQYINYLCKHHSQTFCFLTASTRCWPKSSTTTDALLHHWTQERGRLNDFARAARTGVGNRRPSGAAHTIKKLPQRLLLSYNLAN